MFKLFEKNPKFLLDNPDIVEAFQEISEFKSFKKGELLHEINSICNHFYVIIDGIARVFYLKDGKDITAHIAQEEESITAIDSFIQRKRSNYAIEALEDIQTIAISRDKLENLFSTHPNYEHIGRLFLEQIYIDLVERVVDLQLNSSKERYKNLLEKNPKLFDRVPDKHLATYLNMSAETFSRIKSNQ